ncbi:MAG: hypothetical protein V1875_08170 [Candidatus Altiarchaeota archaeon]
MKNKNKLGILLICLVMGMAGNANAADWLKNPGFNNPTAAFDTGIKSNQDYKSAPSGWAWGLHGYTWGGTGTTIKECGFTSSGGSDYKLKMYGKDDSGKYAVVTLIQGWVWGGSPPASWNRPVPLAVYGKTSIPLTLVVKQNGGNFNVPTGKSSLRNGIINVWMKDESTGRILMMDLYFGQWGSNKGKGTWVGSDGIVHYANTIASVSNNKWTTVNTNLATQIDNAIRAASAKGVGYNKKYLKIYQVEALHEFQYSWGDMWIKSFSMTY